MICGQSRLIWRRLKMSNRNEDILDMLKRCAGSQGIYIKDLSGQEEIDPVHLDNFKFLQGIFKDLNELLGITLTEKQDNDLDIIWVKLSHEFSEGLGTVLLKGGRKIKLDEIEPNEQFDGNGVQLLGYWNKSAVKNVILIVEPNIETVFYVRKHESEDKNDCIVEFEVIKNFIESIPWNADIKSIIISYLKSYPELWKETDSFF